jgi:hypothetical protein
MKKHSKRYKLEQAYSKNKSFLQTTITKTLQEREGLVISLIIRSKSDRKVFSDPPSQLLELGLHCVIAFKNSRSPSSTTLAKGTSGESTWT